MQKLSKRNHKRGGRSIKIGAGTRLNRDRIQHLQPRDRSALQDADSLAGKLPQFPNWIAPKPPAIFSAKNLFVSLHRASIGAAYF
jgi:hypothetical protein